MTLRDIRRIGTIKSTGQSLLFPNVTIRNPNASLPDTDSFDPLRAQTWITPLPYMMLTIQQARPHGAHRLLPHHAMRETALMELLATSRHRRLLTVQLRPATEAIRKKTQWEQEATTGLIVVLGRHL